MGLVRVSHPGADHLGLDLVMWVGGIILLLIGLLLLWASRHLRRRAGLAPGHVIYSDTRSWQESPDPLYAPEVNLAGKPDYLIQRWRIVLPVEVKTGSAPIEPYHSHVLQLAAYCLLVEAAYGARPPYGLIHYSDRTFAVHYTSRLQQSLLDTLDWMRQDLRDGQADRSHDDPARCRACGYAAHCDQRLR
jgi:CRISPR-associated exonuclease Cas4